RTAVADVLNHSHHFPQRRPWKAGADSLAHCRGRISPELTRKILREHGHLAPAVKVCPGVVAASDDFRAGGSQESWWDKFAPSHGRKTAVLVFFPCREYPVPAGSELFHGHVAGERCRLDPGNRRELVQNVTLQSGDALRFGDQGGRNGDPHGLKMRCTG